MKLYRESLFSYLLYLHQRLSRIETGSKELNKWRTALNTLDGCHCHCHGYLFLELTCVQNQVYAWFGHFSYTTTPELFTDTCKWGTLTLRKLIIRSSLTWLKLRNNSIHFCIYLSFAGIFHVLGSALVTQASQNALGHLTCQSIK